MRYNDRINKQNIRSEIIDILVGHQPFIKEELEGLALTKQSMLMSEPAIFREDLNEQYNARIRQWISFYVADRLAIPAEWVIIELEKIDLKDYLDV